MQPCLDAMRGALLAAVLTVSAAAAPMPLRLETAAQTVGRYDMVEFRIEGVGDCHDPFDPAIVEVAVTLSGAGRTSVVPAFFMQDYERERIGGRDWFYPRGLPGWRARVAPLDAGEYTATATMHDASGTRRSEAIRFTSVGSTNLGFLGVSRRDPRWFELSNGHPFFPIGQNLAFIGSQQYVTLTRAEQIFEKLATQGANFVRVWTGCEDWALAIEARKSAWGRSWERRDPVVPIPGVADRRCVLLTNTTTAVNPSHDVGLRPATRYVVSGKARVAEGGALRLEVQGTTAIKLHPEGSAGTWTEFRHEFITGPSDRWLSGMRFIRDGAGEAWVAELSLHELAGGPELLWEADVNRPVRGFYNPLDCFWLDELLRAAQRRGVYLQLCLLTRDLYMSALKDPASAEYDRAIADAKKTFRYAVARWGAFTSVAAWEYWNEMDPGLPTDRFYTELGGYLEVTDTYQHPRTTSTWGPSPKDCRHPKLDIADVHFYLRPTDAARLRDEVEAVLDRAAWLRQHAPGKPAIQGECGLADDQWRITEEMRRRGEVVDFHNMLWASALSGTSSTALPWWWERLDERNHYPHYQPLSRFVADVPWVGGDLVPLSGTTADDQVRVVGLRTRGRAWLWFFNRAAAWKQVVTNKQEPGVLTGVRFELTPWPGGEAQVEWWDTRSGQVVASGGGGAGQGRVLLSAPGFSRDLACRVNE